LTVLADNGIGGLQVRQRSGEWTDVVIPEGTSSSPMGAAARPSAAANKDGRQAALISVPSGRSMCQTPVGSRQQR
jgi:hypothetical protein